MENRAVFLIFIALLRFSFEFPPYVRSAHKGTPYAFQRQTASPAETPVGSSALADEGTAVFITLLVAYRALPQRSPSSYQDLLAME
jgi:hypothetical protein